MELGGKEFFKYVVALAVGVQSVKGDITRDGRCGITNGYSCHLNTCCSPHGWCGNTTEFCGIGCQQLFGRCSDNERIALDGAVVGSLKTDLNTAHYDYDINIDGRCGHGGNCDGDSCCSNHGWCGKSEAYCGVGCQPAFGRCNSNSMSDYEEQTNPPSGDYIKKELHGRCGNGVYCPSDSCCSEHGWCGTTTDFCGDGCQPEFGLCTKNFINDSTNLPERTAGMHAGKCGHGVHCSQGNCCSLFGWCGTTEDYCGVGCQASFGRCDSHLIEHMSCTRPGVVALTFDDGPVFADSTILDVLLALDVKASFFVLGKNIDENFQESYPLLRRMRDEGHVIGSHGYSHRNYLELSTSEVEDEMSKTDHAIHQVVGKYPQYFRFPFGYSNAELLSKISDLGYTSVFWNLDSFDWETNVAEDMLTSYNSTISAADQLSNSFILLHHSWSWVTLNILSELIELVRSLGYQFVTIDECIGVPIQNREINGLQQNEE